MAIVRSPIKTVLIDSREPIETKSLTFGGKCSVSVGKLEAGDFWVITDDDKVLVVERKTPDDFLGTLGEGRLFPQMVGLQKLRMKYGYIPYLLITGEFFRTADGFVQTLYRETHWNWDAVHGALLEVQELGVFVMYCADDNEIEATLSRLAERKRPELKNYPPAKIGNVANAQESILCSLRGITPDKAVQILKYCGTPAWALAALTSKDTKVPGVGVGMKHNIRAALGLEDNEGIAIVALDEEEKLPEVVIEKREECNV